MHVVERVEAYDHVTRNRFVTRYACHHGYYSEMKQRAIVGTAKSAARLGGERNRTWTGPAKLVSVRPRSPTAAGLQRLQVRAEGGAGVAA